ncbi:MAG: MATE family efflux transporter [Clostridiaceae bacterium]
MFRLETIKDSLKLALPAVGEMVLYMMIWVFDTMMVGKYGGSLAVSTVGLSSEIMYTVVNIFIMYGVSIGIASLVARSIGSDQTSHAEEYATLGLAFGFFLSLALFLFLFFFSRDILLLAGAENEVVQQGSMFIRIASIGMFFYMLMSILNAMLRGYGDTRTPLLASVLVNIINLGLDWILIFGHYGFPELGIKGAAIATCTAQTIGFIFIVFYVCKISRIKPRIKYLLNFNFTKLKMFLRLSLPSTLQEASIDLARLFGAFIVMHLGTLSFAANQITITVESVSFMPGWGFAIAATTLVGMKVGEKNIDKAKEYAYTCTVLGVIVMTFCAVLFVLFPNFFISLFIDSKETQVIYLGALCLMIAAVEQPFLAVSMILGGALKGCGDTKTPFIVSLISCWGIRIPLMVYLIYILKMSVIYVWWITAFQWFFEAVVLLILFNRSLKKYSIANENEQ